MLVTETKIDNYNETWSKRQKEDGTECLPPPSNPTPISTATNSCSDINNHDLPPKVDCQAKHQCSNGSDFNSSEFQFFITAIEKLKATSLFQEEDLKKMTDEQIYEALIEHARVQRSKFNQTTSLFTPSSNVNHNLLESIDKEQEEDLPIIMRNLHSVKSLKHFFEIRAKSTNNNSNSTIQSPLLQNKNTNLETKEAKSNALQDLFIKNSQLIEKSIKHGLGVAVNNEKDDQNNNVTKNSDLIP